MRTSLNEIRLIEEYLSDRLNVRDRLLFQARILTSPSLRLNVWLQKKILQLLRQYHKKKIRDAAGQYHEQFFHNPQNGEYRKRIMNLFTTRHS